MELSLIGEAAETVSSPNLLLMSPSPVRVLRSSASLAWRGIVLERHYSSSGERRPDVANHDVISMFLSNVCHFEYRHWRGDIVRTSARPSTIMTTPAGPLPQLRFPTPVELIHCALERGFVSEVSRELDRPPREACFRAALQDKAIQRILALLLDELESHQPFGRLYVDSLAHALATRFLLLDTPIDRPSTRSPALLPRVLRRVREKIEANLEADLSLESLAEESGYSRAHFLRMFRAATGLTPHQYVMELRLARAQERLRQAGSSIVEVAVSCGFASQSHMTSVFRRRLELTPGAFRRNS